MAHHHHPVHGPLVSKYQQQRYHQHMISQLHQVPDQYEEKEILWLNYSIGDVWGDHENNKKKKKKGIRHLNKLL